MSLERKIDKMLNCSFQILGIIYEANALYFLYDVLFNQDSIEAKAGKIIYSAVSGVLSYYILKD